MGQFDFIPLIELIVSEVAAEKLVNRSRRQRVRTADDVELNGVEVEDCSTLQPIGIPSRHIDRNPICRQDRHTPTPVTLLTHPRITLVCFESPRQFLVQKR